MEYRRLGKSGIKVSEIGFGGVDFGGRLNEKESISVITYALDLGVNFIDTADVYSGGRSEEFVGKAVRGRRSKVIIATKFGLPTGEHPNDYGGSRAHIMEAIDASLKRLGTDYIDLYYLHWPDPTTPIEETLQTLNGLVRAGKVRYIGCSNFTAWQLCEALWTSKENNLESFIVVQSQYNLLERSIELELVPSCQAYGIGVIPWGPLAGGFLTGKYHRGKTLPAGARLSQGQSRTSQILSEANFDRLEKMEAFAEEHGHSMGELAIAWLLSHPWLSSVIAGATKPEQVTANTTASNWKLTTQEITQLG